MSRTAIYLNIWGPLLCQLAIRTIYITNKIGSTEATAFLGGNIFWKPLADSPRTVELTYRLTWQQSEAPKRFCIKSPIIDERGGLGDPKDFSICQNGCEGGHLGESETYCADQNSLDNWVSSLGKVNYTLPLNSDKFEIGLGGCCWANHVQDSGGKEWKIMVSGDLSNRDDTNKINNAPIPISTPYLKLEKGCQHKFKINSYDEDGDEVRCRLGRTERECGKACGFLPGVAIDELTCEVTVIALGTSFQSGLYPITILMEDYPANAITITKSWGSRSRERALSRVTVQMMIEIYDSEFTTCALQELSGSSVDATLAAINEFNPTLSTLQIVQPQYPQQQQFGQQPQFVLQQNQQQAPFQLQQQQQPQYFQQPIQNQQGGQFYQQQGPFQPQPIIPFQQQFSGSKGLNNQYQYQPNPRLTPPVILAQQPPPNQPFNDVRLLPAWPAPTQAPFIPAPLVQPDLNVATNTECIEIPISITFQGTIFVRSPVPDFTVQNVFTVSPPGLTTSPVFKVTNNPPLYGQNISWVPTSSQRGPNSFCFFAVNSVGQRSATSCLTLYVSETQSGTSGCGKKPQVLCTNRGVQVSLQVDDPKFNNGMFYVKNHFKRPGCQLTLPPSGRSEARLNIPLGACGLEVNPETMRYEMIVVLQPHSMLVTSMARAYHVVCQPPQGMVEIPVRNKADIDMITTEGTLRQTHMPPMPTMLITSEDGQPLNRATLGQTIRIYLYVPNEVNYEMRVRSCVARAMERTWHVNLIDDNGCAVDSSVFPQFLPYSKGSLVSDFPAFKFPDSEFIQFECVITVCWKKCPERMNPICDGSGLSPLGSVVPTNPAWAPVNVIPAGTNNSAPSGPDVRVIGSINDEAVNAGRQRRKIFTFTKILSSTSHAPSKLGQNPQEASFDDISGIQGYAASEGDDDDLLSSLEPHRLGPYPSISLTTKSNLQGHLKPQVSGKEEDELRGEDIKVASRFLRISAPSSQTGSNGDDGSREIIEEEQEEILVDKQEVRDNNGSFSSAYYSERHSISEQIANKGNPSAQANLWKRVEALKSSVCLDLSQAAGENRAKTVAFMTSGLLAVLSSVGAGITYAYTKEAGGFGVWNRNRGGGSCVTLSQSSVSTAN